MTGPAANLPDPARLASRLFDGFARLSADVEGVTRPAFSAVESACLDLVAETGAAHGLMPHRDAVGNLWLAPQGMGNRIAPACGSHMDSVPRGGNFDGAAGVVAGVICAIRAAQEGWPLRALALRGEESPWFGAPHVGARAAFGSLTAAECAIGRRDTGRSLADHITEIGGSPAAACSGRALPEVARTSILYELHIEQGPELVTRGLAAAAVGSVRGHIRWPRIMCRGEAGHSGTVPRHLRHDPVMAVAELLQGLDLLWGRSMQEGADIVVTAGMLNVDPAEASPTRIPDLVTFSLDVRSSQRATLAAMQQAILRACAEIAARRGVAFDLGRLVEAEPVMLERTARLAIEQALPGSITLNSGAGHDAAEFVRQGTPAAMVFVRNRNGSHNPQEHMDIPDLLVGIDALHQAMRAQSAAGR